MGNSKGGLHAPLCFYMNIPQHIAIIMDGNGRWAKERGLSRLFGHKKGVDRVQEIVRVGKELGVKIITVFAFSTENWKRPQNEIKTLFFYMETFLKKYKRELIKEDIRLNIIGRRDRIREQSRKIIEDVEASTRNNKSFVFNVALDYGGRWDILEAAKLLMKDMEKSKVLNNDIDENYFQKYLSLHEYPDPDLLIRTSGEQRISNFLLWQLAYAEFYFPKVCWPDFGREQFEKALRIYAQRQRRYGAV